MIAYLKYILINIRIFLYFIGRMEIEFFINSRWILKEFKNFKYFLFEQEDKNYNMYWEFLDKVSYNDKGTCFVGFTFLVVILFFLLDIKYLLVIFHIF